MKSTKYEISMHICILIIHCGVELLLTSIECKQFMQQHRQCKKTALFFYYTIRNIIEKTSIIIFKIYSITVMHALWMAELNYTGRYMVMSVLHIQYVVFLAYDQSTHNSLLVLGLSLVITTTQHFHALEMNVMWMYKECGRSNLMA